MRFKNYLLLLSLFLYSSNALSQKNITIAILAKDKAHCLPFYLYCLEQQTWPKDKTNLYIRTNNNNDNTSQILKDWVEKVKDQYSKVYFDDSDLTVNLEQYGQHEWNTVRFKALAKIRQDSIKWAFDNDSNYFVADCDNFILPSTITKLVESDMPIVAPLLVSRSSYSNYHAAIDSWGYYSSSPIYFPLLYREIKGLVQLPVVHCTYFINYNVLDEISYFDKTNRHEYVIFSENARKRNIAQYLDTRAVYGFITFAENSKDFEEDIATCKELVPLIKDFKKQNKNLKQNENKSQES